MSEIENIGNLAAIRGRLGVEEDDPSKDEEILRMTPLQRVRLIAGWELGDEGWADTFKSWFEGQGLYLTTNPEGDGVVGDD
jgi:hypothetical protein